MIRSILRDSKSAPARWGIRITTTLLVLAVLGASRPDSVLAQATPGGSASSVAGDTTLTSAADSVSSLAVPVPSAGLPIFFTFGAGYGQRSDACAQCTSPENTDSFTGHLGIGKYLGYGLGIGVDASVWRRGHPGPMLAADSTGAPTATSLSNTLGNTSLSLSLQVWKLWVRGGVGVAWGAQDFETIDADGDADVLRASGKGIGYSVGGGVAIPLAGAVSLALFGNWNVGSYDLASPAGILQRDAEHEYVEVGFGLTIR